MQSITHILQYKRLLTLNLLTFLISLNTSAMNLEVHGNKRSKSSLIKKLYSRCTQIEDNKNDLDLEQCLMNSRLFSKVEIKNLDNGSKSITVEERWTLIPIPFFRKDRGEKKAGFFVIEQNFLGLGKFAFLGAIKGDRSETYMAMYRDPLFMNSDNTFGVFLMDADTSFFRYRKLDEVDGHEAKQKRARIDFGKVDKYIQSDFGLEWTRSEYKKVDSYVFTPDDNASLKIGARFRYSDTKFKFYFQEGSQIQLKLDTELYQEDEGKKSTLAELVYNHQFNTRSDEVLQSSIYVIDVINQGSEDIVYAGGRKGLRGAIQNSIWAKSIMSFSLDYQIPLLDKTYGTWTVGPYADYSWYVDFDQIDTWKNSYGVGVGGYLFLKKIALPGLGILVGWNPEFEGSYSTVSVGFSF